MSKSDLVKSRIFIIRDIPQLSLTRPVFTTKKYILVHDTVSCNPKEYKGFYRGIIDYVSKMKPMENSIYGSSQKVWEDYTLRMSTALRSFAAPDLNSKVELYDTDDDMFGYTVDYYQFNMPAKDFKFLVEFSTDITVESALGPIRRYIIDKLPRMWRSKLSNRFRAKREMHMKVWVDPDNYMDFSLYSESIPVDRCGLGYIVENAKWSGIPSLWKNYGLENYEQKQYELRKRFFWINRGSAIDDKRQFPRSVVERVRRTRKDDAS